ncbi:DUF4956 domain-containing protein [Nocardioides caeni]|uniref:DUF4956 domain-containing protein n=1 Tax=Nocardioides caeni TaxID=574700 RepID=A0A4S8NNZ9_9ACTN|nr:DUF4956 domain-containing protein [Nocardioides caeni]THV18295.1 DUF4956 domain-containing protein [Nocardioides caeni]
MSPYALYAVDLVAIAILVLGLFLPRHRRPELVVAFLTVNVGVMAVAAALATSTIGAGLGLGLFGILSLIRLRSEELAQSEIAYYFAALALGLLAGIDQSPTLVDVGLMAAILAAVAIGDTVMGGQRTQTQQLLLDRAITDQEELREELTVRLGTTIHSFRVDRTDLVNDTTLVSVRHHPRSPTRREQRAAGMPAQEMLR